MVLLYKNKLLEKIPKSSKLAILLIFLLILWIILIKDSIWIAPLMIYSILECFINSDELSDKMITAKGKDIYFFGFSYNILIPIITVFAVCTGLVNIKDNNLNNYILVLYVIIYIYEFILFTLCLNPRKMINFIRNKGYRISKIEDYKKLLNLLIIIGCVPPIILILIV